MNRFSSNNVRGGGGGSRFYNSTYPRYSSGLGGSDSEETSSTHSVRVSRLIEKIKSQQREGRGYVPNSGDFNYFGGGGQDRVGERGGDRSGDLIYSRVERDVGDERKRTVRERVQSRGRDTRDSSVRESTPLHKTTVLLNSDEGDTSGEYYGRLYSDRYTQRGFGSGARYFGQETDYEEDRYLSRREREAQRGTLLREQGRFGSGRVEQKVNNSSSHATHATHVSRDVGSVARNSVPKIILHEEAVAEIPNGRGVGNGGGGTRSPSFARDVVTTDDEFEKGGGKRSSFLGGFLTLKRGKKGGKDGGGTIRSTTSRSPSGTTTRASSYLNVPGANNRNSLDNANDSSSSPKYYVPYYRSTPTLYESKYERDRMSSAGGSVLSNGSYVAKNVSRSMSMKAPWEPRHRANEINYYNEAPYKGPPPPQEKPVKRTNLSRSKSMPGKKLTSIIGSWVSKGTLRRGSGGAQQPTQHDGGSREKIVEEDHERLINSKGKQKEPGKWGTLLRFGKGGKSKTQGAQVNGDSKGVFSGRAVSPERPVRGKKVVERKGEDLRGHHQYRSSESPVRGGGLGGVGNRNSYAGGGGGGTLLRNTNTFERSKRATLSGGGGGGRGFY